MSTYFRKLLSKARTLVSLNHNLGEFQLDNIAIISINTSEVMKVKAIGDGEFDSDHYLSKVKIRFLPPSQNNLSKMIGYNVNQMNITQDMIKNFRPEIRITGTKNWRNGYQRSR